MSEILVSGRSVNHKTKERSGASGDLGFKVRFGSPVGSWLQRTEKPEAAEAEAGGHLSRAGGPGPSPPSTLSARSDSSSRPPGPEEASSAVAMAMRREEGGPSQGGFLCVERGGAPVGIRSLGWLLDELRQRVPSSTTPQALPVLPTP